LNISRKILYLVKVRPNLEAVRTPILQGMYIHVLFSVFDLLFPRLPLDFRSLQLRIPSQVVQLIEKLATGRLVRGPAATASHHVPALLPISREARAPLTHLDDGRSRPPSLVNLLTVADHEQVRNLPMPGKWPQRRACVPDWSRKCDRPVVTIATAREVGAITEAVSVRIAEIPLCYPRHPRSTPGVDQG
jgi:hypothetical protein